MLGVWNLQKDLKHSINIDMTHLAGQKLHKEDWTSSKLHIAVQATVPNNLTKQVCKTFLYSAAVITCTEKPSLLHTDLEASFSSSVV